jgi:hypothetical protein
MIAARKGTEPGLQTHSGLFRDVQCAGVVQGARIGNTAGLVECVGSVSERAFSVNVQWAGVVQGARIGNTAGLCRMRFSGNVQWVGGVQGVRSRHDPRGRFERFQNRGA